ncbi:hypothetical protein [Rhodococcus pyridinivorans]|uniref:hypothetical protein n=1 Tax=Rhodococcus pyridinivorans TaxID=103816 RepID=UPI0020C749A6|nr:hypothetical protein [Rhodococcus pyridinivorans]
MQRGGSITPNGTPSRSEASYYGPSYMIDYLWNDSPAGELETVLINCGAGMSSSMSTSRMLRRTDGVPRGPARAMIRAGPRAIGTPSIELRAHPIDTFLPTIQPLG